MDVQLSYVKFITICHNRRLKPTNVCKEAGLSSNIVTAINNDKNIALESAAKLALYLEVKIDDLVSYSEKNKGT